MYKINPRNIFLAPYRALDVVGTVSSIGYSFLRSLFIPDYKPLFYLLNAIPKNDKKSFAIQTSSLISLQSLSIDDRIRIIRTLADTSSENRESIVTEALRLIREDMSIDDRIRIVKVLNNSYSTEDRASVVTQALRLIREDMSVDERIGIISILNHHYSTEDRASVVTQARRLIREDMSANNIIAIIRYINRYGEPLITEALRLIQEDTSDSDRLEILRLLSNSNLNEHREAIVTQTVRLIREDMSPANRIRILIFLSNSSHSIQDIESIVTQLLEISEGTSTNSLIRNIIEIFDDSFTDKKRFITSNRKVDENPIEVILDLFQLLNINQINLFPPIDYTDSPAIDEGGLTRSLVSSLVKSFCNPIHHLVKKSELGVIPIIEESSSRTLEDQEKCFKIIGVFFSIALQKYKSVVIGQHFHPIIFKMIFNLSKEDLVNIGSLKVFDKMLKIYLQEEFKLEAELAKNILENNITEELRNIYFINSKKEFIKDHKLDKQIKAILIIAKSMYDFLLDPTEWNSLKGNSANTLQDKIQGILSNDQVVNAFQNSDTPNKTSLEYIKRWSRETNSELLQKFVKAISGLTTLNNDQQLNIILRNNDIDRLPVFHTCGFSVELSKYSSYQTFKEKLEISLTHCFEGSGFQIS